MGCCWTPRHCTRQPCSCSPRPTWPQCPIRPSGSGCWRAPRASRWAAGRAGLGLELGWGGVGRGGWVEVGWGVGGSQVWRGVEGPWRSGVAPPGCPLLSSLPQPCLSAGAASGPPTHSPTQPPSSFLVHVLPVAHPPTHQLKPPSSPLVQVLLVTKAEEPPPLFRALSSNFRHYKIDFGVAHASDEQLVAGLGVKKVGQRGAEGKEGGPGCQGGPGGKEGGPSGVGSQGCGLLIKR